MTKSLWLIACAAIAFYCVITQAGVWQPTPGHTQVTIWPEGKMPDAIPITKPESVTTSKGLIAGKPVTLVWDVTQPTMTIYPPQKNNTGIAIVVFPGGGFNGLAIDLEGTEICNKLTLQGITCALLKYRVPDSGPAWHESCKCHIVPKAPTALQDAQRTVGLLRLNAIKWHIDPNKIGVLGFSAGGYMVADISSHFKKRAYKPVDAADNISCRPDFAVALYPGHIWENEGINEKKFIMNPNITFTKQTPPTFILPAEDDPVDNINHSLLYYIALKNAKVPTEMHLYANGGHAFGARQTNLPITEWPQLLETWLQTTGMMSL